MSSIIVYGSGEVGKDRVITKDTPLTPDNFYGDSKKQAEIRLGTLQDERFKVVILRPPMIYGPNSKGNYPMLAKLARKTPIFPNIKNQRSMLYVGNLVEFVRLMIENEEEGIFLPQNDEYTCTAELVKEIAKIHHHRIWFTKLFNPMIKLFKKETHINKLFGNLTIERSLSDYKETYCQYSLIQTLKQTDTKMKRALMYASVASMIQQFNMNNIKLLIELGYKVDVACNFEFGSTISNDKIEQLKRDLTNLGVDYYHIPISRKISDLRNIYKAYQLSKKLMNENKYDLIHCHSPIGGLICREANKHSENYNNCRMIYTAHGFHFFKGNNPIKNIIFKSIEKHAAKYTDILITINKEDYEAASTFKLKADGYVEYIPGVGIDIKKINSIKGNKEKMCIELNISVDSILLLSVGELNVNKNHISVIKCLPNLANNIHYIICGQGPLKDEYLKLAEELNVRDRLHILGYRNDVLRIMKSCDLFVFPSKREGLSVALMEAMACGLPCIASNIRGNQDLLDKRYLFNDINNEFRYKDYEFSI